MKQKKIKKLKKSVKRTVASPSEFYSFVVRIVVQSSALLIVSYTFFFLFGVLPKTNSIPPFRDSMPPIVERNEEKKTLVCRPTKGDQILCQRESKTVREQNDLRKLVPELDRAKIVYNRFDTMWRGKPETIVLKIDLTKPPELSEVLRGERKRAEIIVGKFVSAKLMGTAGLKVEPKSPAKVRISKLATSSWQWNVTPTKTASTELLTLQIGLHVDRGDPYPLQSYEDQITVKVTTAQQVGDFVGKFNPIWASLVGFVTVVLGAIAWIVKKFRRPKSERTRTPFSERDRPDSATKKPIKKQNSD